MSEISSSLREVTVCMALPLQTSAREMNTSPYLHRANMDSHRLLHLGKTMTMFNEVFRLHGQAAPDCRGTLSWDLEGEERRGLASRMRMKCMDCSFVSDHYNLYQEVETKSPGRRAAAVNYGLQVGLSQTPLGNDGLRKILLATNTPPPSRKSLQKSSNEVLAKIEDINDEDMRRRCRQLVEVNTLRGDDSPHTIAVQSDGMYNNPLYSGVGETPFQPATQTVYSFAENVTSKHQIIKVVTKNKICAKHGHLLDEGDICHCCSPGVCGANLPMHHTIGDEFTWAKEGMTELRCESGLEVREVTTDPDSAAGRAAQSLYQGGLLKKEPIHYIDTRHLSESIRKSIKKDNKLEQIMPGRTKSERIKQLHNFALDAVDRCTAEINQAQDAFAGDADKLKNKLSYAKHAIVNCYMGDHAMCRKHSLVCKGGVKCNWIRKSTYLSDDFKIPCSAENENLLHACISKRLSPAVLAKTIKNSNSQKVESFNRTLRRSLPRNVTFTRNFSGRVHSAVHSSNYGPGKSIQGLCAGIGAAIPTGGSVYKSLDKVQKDYEYSKTYQKSPSQKLKRVAKRKKLYKLYEKHQEEVKYKKNIMLSEFRTRGKKSADPEHSYSKSNQ